ncbi:energy-coupling factor transport system substrate-specific component [Nocardioides salarius]|uniref:Energy-coupling factor transport system substrate-specific component n=1 Tax=Nocardioides salarius TaxID=374513 RepID=A0ABS2M7N0_9ACTN|nr:ECF transporter S component [Nocardioides salarius]MBM7507190.1 energy-coupling factor transport system substrate-specific component [Nocardioides salarius]
MSDTPTQSPQGSEWDLLANRLQQLRLEAGEPSYGEIARRVARGRLDAGLGEHEARVARTTVYDVFRTGRARVNLELVREIVRVLGGEDLDVDRWVAQCRRGGAAPAPAPAPVPATGTTPQSTPPPTREPTTHPTDDDPALPTPPPALRLAMVLAGLCVVVNLAGRFVVDVLQLPIFLDMIGTAVAAIALGPWYGVAVGLTSNLAGTAVSGTDSIPFALVNMAGALVWGYGVRRFAMGRTLLRFMGLNVLVAVTCTLVAIPVLVLLYGGGVGHSQDFVTATFIEMTGLLEVAVGLSNMVVSLGDKIISGFVALVACSTLPLALRRRTPLVLVSPRLGGPDS